jgi:hypothetical protein
MMQATLRAMALLALTATLAGCVVYEPGPGYGYGYAAPAPGYAYAAPAPAVYGPPVYGSVVIGGGWGGGRRWR